MTWISRPSRKSKQATKIKTFEDENVGLAVEQATVVIPDGTAIINSDGTASHVDISSEQVGIIQSRVTKDSRGLATSDAIMTHNHPGNNGFSPNDATFAAGTEMSELRAVGDHTMFSRDPNRVPSPIEGKHIYRMTAPTTKNYPAGQSMDASFHSATKRLSPKYNKLVKSGKISRWDAEAEINHATLKSMAKRWKFGYSRTIIREDGTIVSDGVGL